MSTETLERARWLVSRGCSVFPVDHPRESAHKDHAKRGKTPIIAWKPFQHTRATDADLALWFGNGHLRNVGLVTGAVSNVVIVDCDSSEAVTWADEHLPLTPWRVRTGKGEHRGYRHPRTSVPNRVRIRTDDAAIKIDVRGDGGYVVAPGSEHASGVIYEWIGGPPSIDDLPMFDPAWLAPDETTATETAAAPALPATIATGARNDTLFREACRLRRLGWSDEEIVKALQIVNESRCSPTLDRREIEGIAHSAARYEPLADTFPQTETGDAEFFAACNADALRYDHRRGRWLLFTEHVWTPQTNGEVARLALDAVRARQAAALKSSGDGRTKRIQWAVGGEARKRLSSVVALAQNTLPLAESGDRWDADPWLLGAPNGVIDLRTGFRRDGRPEDLITMRVRAPFDAAATCPLFDRTVSEIFEGDSELIAYVDRYLGYSLTGICREESLAMCWGDGANGKGTLMNTFGWLLGDYADDLPFSAFELHERSGIPNDIAKIVGKRFVTASETGETVRLNEARIKALTGQDPITARFLHREFFTFQPMAKFWLATNHKPEVRDDSEGFWRRLHLIPFAASFIGREDRTLKDRLREEMPGILARAVRGCLASARRAQSAGRCPRRDELVPGRQLANRAIPTGLLRRSADCKGEVR